MQISSVVQIRGSIPLFWSQDTSPLIVRPDIQSMNFQKPFLFPFWWLFFNIFFWTLCFLCPSVSKDDPNYQATRLHFENLVRRYGNPILILNLIKVIFLLCLKNQTLNFHQPLLFYVLGMNVNLSFALLVVNIDCDKQIREKKPRETVLRAEFANAVRVINSTLEKENQLRLFQWDLHKHSRWYFVFSFSFFFKNN